MSNTPKLDAALAARSSTTTNSVIDLGEDLEGLRSDIEDSVKAQLVGNSSNFNPDSLSVTLAKNDRGYFLRFECKRSVRAVQDMFADLDEAKARTFRNAGEKKGVGLPASYRVDTAADLIAALNKAVLRGENQIDASKHSGRVPA